MYKHKAQIKQCTNIVPNICNIQCTYIVSNICNTGLRLKFENLSQIIGIFFLGPWAQPLWISQKGSVSALAQPLA